MEHTDFTYSDDPASSPLCSPLPGHTLLHALADIVEREDFTEGEQLWRVLKLAVALWGELPEGSDTGRSYKRQEACTVYMCRECVWKSHSLLSDADSYDYQLLRKQALYQWLKHTSEQITESEVTAASSEHYLEAVFSLVCGQQLGAACRLAQKHSDHKLALLLSQAVSNTVVNK